jgi:hypothetical protein
MITVKVRRNSTVLDRLLRNAPALSRAEVHDAAEDAVKDVRAHWSGRYPPASSAGQPPAMRSEELDKNIFAIPVETLSSGKVTEEIQVRVPYGPALEFGTYKMRARPFLRPAMLRARKTFKGRWKRVVTP